MFKEFKSFILRGNVLDLAIGIIIGGAFGKIVSSLVVDILMPPIGMILGKVDFSSLFIALNGQSYPSLAEAKKAGAPTVNYGIFVNTLIDFLIVAFCIFLVVRVANRLMKPEAAKPPSPNTKDCPLCLMTIPIAAKKCGHCTSAVSSSTYALVELRSCLGSESMSPDQKLDDPTAFSQANYKMLSFLPHPVSLEFMLTKIDGYNRTRS